MSLSSNISQVNFFWQNKIISLLTCLLITDLSDKFCATFDLNRLTETCSMENYGKLSSFSTLQFHQIYKIKVGQVSSLLKTIHLQDSAKLFILMFMLHSTGCFWKDLDMRNLNNFFFVISTLRYNKNVW